jgi:plastocyanin
MLACGALLALAPAGCNRRDQVHIATQQSEVEKFSKLLVSEKKAVEAPVAVATFQHTGGFQTIKGKIHLDGSPAERKTINDQITKDREICDPGGAPVLSERLIVNPAGGGIANVVLYLKSEPKRQIPISDSAKTPSAGAAPELDNQQCRFVPHVLCVNKGFGKLTLTNRDPVDHNMNIQPRAGRASNVTIPKNSSGAYELTAEEVMPFAVTCTIHPWMKGYVQIRDNGYFAVTDKDGNFKIENLPTGDVLTIQVWHEAAGKEGGFLPQMTITGADDAKPVKGGFTVKLDKDKAPGDLDIALPPAVFSGA